MVFLHITLIWTPHFLHSLTLVYVYVQRLEYRRVRTHCNYTTPYYSSISTESVS